jgi:ribosomal protein S19
MSRSNWKSIVSSLLVNKKNKFVWKRNLKIASNTINKPLFIHTGKFFKRILPTRDKIGFSFGDFCRTRKYNKSKKRIKLKKKNS